MLKEKLLQTESKSETIKYIVLILFGIVFILTFGLFFYTSIYQLIRYTSSSHFDSLISYYGYVEVTRFMRGLLMLFSVLFLIKNKSRVSVILISISLLLAVSRTISYAIYFDEISNINNLNGEFTLYLLTELFLLLTLVLHHLEKQIISFIPAVLVMSIIIYSFTNYFKLRRFISYRDLYLDYMVFTSYLSYFLTVLAPLLKDQLLPIKMSGDSNE